MLPQQNSSVLLEHYVYLRLWYLLVPLVTDEFGNVRDGKERSSICRKRPDDRRIESSGEHEQPFFTVRLYNAVLDAVVLQVSIKPIGLVSRLDDIDRIGENPRKDATQSAGGHDDQRVGALPFRKESPVHVLVRREVDAERWYFTTKCDAEALERPTDAVHEVLLAQTVDGSGILGTIDQTHRSLLLLLTAHALHLQLCLGQFYGSADECLKETSRRPGDEMRQ